MRYGSRTRSGPALACLLLALVACGPAITPPPTEAPLVLRIGFEDSVRPLVEAVVAVYGDETRTSSLEIEDGHGDDLLNDLRAERLDVLFVTDEADGEGGWWQSPVALDGLALIANPDNQVTGLTLSQAQDIFQGQIWLWEMVGGAPAEIEVVSREENSAMWELFQSMVMEERRVTLTAVLVPDTEAVLEYVALHPWAVGYVAAATVDERVKLLAVDGLYPLPETLTDQSYPLCFPIYLVALQEPDGAARRFPAWLLSRDGQAVIGRQYGRAR